MRSRRIAWATLAACAVLLARDATGEVVPYSDVAVWAAPPSGDPYGFVPGGNRGPTVLGEVSLVREAAFDPDSGPAPTTGVGTEATWSGLVPGDPAADGVFAQSVYLRIGPVSTCEYVPDGVVTLTFGPGLRVVGAIAKKSGLDATDPAWGVAWIHYGGASRGIEGGDTLAVTASPAGDQVRLSGDVLCSSQIDDVRLLVDHGAAWQSGAWVDVVAAQQDCAAGEACNADINVGGIDGDADPDGDPWHADTLAVRVPLASVEEAPTSAVPTVTCPVDASGAWIAGTLDEPEGSRVHVFAWSPDGTLFLVGETSVGADGTWALDLDPAWPWGFGAGWSVAARAINDADGEQPGPFGDPVAVGDSDCDGWADGDDCWPLDPDRFPGGPDPCNGQDDDCDGSTDEDFPTLGDACDGADADLCANGVEVCTADGTGVECAEPGAGFTDVCNGFDDDCDGATDEDFPTLGDACDGADADLCANGALVCTADGTGVKCAEPGDGIADVCNGFDDDCDGATDEDFPTLGDACDGADADFCANGALVCALDGMGVTCDEPGAGFADVCNGVDDDCDGATDEDFPTLGDACDGADADFCANGVLVCAGDGLGVECDEPGDGIAETCNGRDDDCDGATDEDFPTLGDACDGADADLCANGVLVCALDGSIVTCDEPGDGFADVCNGLDDDCDGATDEDFPTLGDACDGADADFCTTGTWACTAGGGIACDEAGEGNVETCNGRDDDCDGDTDEGFPDVNRNGVADCMEPEGRGFRGGGGCVAGAGPGAGTGTLLLPFAIAALAFARRRRFAATVAFLAGLALAGASRPAVAQQVDPDLFLPAPSTWDGIALRTTRPMEHLSHRYGLNLAWAKDLLVGEDDAGRPMRAIAHRATAVVTAAIGLWNRLDIGLALPVHLRQTADGYPAPGASSAATGLGDLVLAPKVALWVPRDGWGPGVAIAVDLTFPTGRSRLMGESNVTVTPWVLLDWRFGGPVLALDLGWKVRKDVTVRDLGIGDEFRVRLGGEVPVGWRDLSLLAEVDAALGIQGGFWGARGVSWDTTPVEVRGAVRWRGPRHLQVTAGAGGGVTRGYGAPDIRVFAAVAWTAGVPPVKRPEPPPKPPARVFPNPPPWSPGGAQEQAAAIAAAVAADPDPDGDGLTAPVDACPDAAEDLDGFRDEDGCPEPDNDDDGIPDARDRCPLEPETINGVDDEDGCPDVGASRVVVSQERIEILDKVFFETGTDTLEARSHDVLRQVASVLKASPWIRRLRVEGHTDDVGHPDLNVDLSERRAARVTEFLIEQGVEPGRLDAQGYGATRPLVPNRTDEGRARNRRVEFRIVDPAPGGAR